MTRSRLAFVSAMYSFVPVGSNATAAVQASPVTIVFVTPAASTRRIDDSLPTSMLSGKYTVRCASTASCWGADTHASDADPSSTQLRPAAPTTADAYHAVPSMPPRLLAAALGITRGQHCVYPLAASAQQCTAAHDTSTARVSPVTPFPNHGGMARGSAAPQHTMPPAVVSGDRMMPQVAFAPAASALNLMSGGGLLCPMSSLPQHTTVPSPRSAQAWLPPAATRATSVSASGTLSRPASATAPQHTAAPPVVAPHAKSLPPAMCISGASGTLSHTPEPESQLP